MSLLHTYPLDTFSPEKETLVYSGGFTQKNNPEELEKRRYTGESLQGQKLKSLERLHNMLGRSFNIVSYDNAGHGSQSSTPFSIEGQKILLQRILSDQGIQKTPLHLVGNSLPGVFSTHALAKILEEKKEKMFHTLTLLSPSLSMKGTFHHNDFSYLGWYANNIISKKLLQNNRTRKHIANKILRLAYGTNADLHELFALGEEFDQQTLKALEKLANAGIRITIVYNADDSIVVGTDHKARKQKKDFLRALEGVQLINSGSTKRHYVCIQKNYKERFLVCGKKIKNEDKIIAHALEEFILQEK